MNSKRQPFFHSLSTLLKRKFSMLLIAFMLGMSNVILEEDRTINDTRVKIEQQEITPEDNLMAGATIGYEESF